MQEIIKTTIVILGLLASGLLISADHGGSGLITATVVVLYAITNNKEK